MPQSEVTSRQVRFTRRKFYATRNKLPLVSLTTLCQLLRGRDNTVGIATRYGKDGPGIELQWGARFSTPVQTGPGAQPASYTTGTGSFLGVKRPGRGVGYPSTSSAEVEGRVELYNCSLSGPSWPVMG